MATVPVLFMYICGSSEIPASLTFPRSIKSGTCIDMLPDWLLPPFPVSKMSASTSITSLPAVAIVMKKIRTRTLRDKNISDLMEDSISIS